MKSLLHGLLGKTLQLVGYTVQYNCVAHCVFEHVGGAVIYNYVPMDHVWLEGGNLHNSTDCRYFGPIPCGLIRGCVFFKIWPLSDLDFYLKALNGHRSHND
uniref:Peptidase S26 domain-containing protein n=1 Tax=Balaenoptera musculus TaxID=9771 RepID=A0A8C0CQK7_BALMU